ncbi:HEAT repeat-containing protein [Promicromonospora thailandica]|uniref:HEAT repeat-containing protein n=2 Tax=Promicromonospora thailandica TaxID=765201 RepID=A0A9X2G5N0_9MICO|nr:HEAT repeat-containing protein [Promicromonospora thailandica]
MDRVRGGDETARGVAEALAPLALLGGGLHEDATGYVLHGTTPEVLTRLAAAGTEDVDRLLGQPGRVQYWSSWISPELVKQVAAAHKGWTTDKGLHARRRFYAAAPVEQVVRLSRLLAQVSDTVEIPGVPEWLSLLLHDTGHVGSGRRGSGNGDGAVRERWTPQEYEAAASEGGVPSGDAPRTVLVGIVHRATRSRSWHADARDGIVASAAFDEYVTRHVAVVADLAPTLTAPGKEALLGRIGRRLTESGSGPAGLGDLARITAALAVDPAKGVRAAALQHLATLPDTQQVALLAPFLTTTPSGRLGEAATRLAALDGGLVACETALAALRDQTGRAAAGHGARLKLLEQTVERARALESPQEDVVVDLPAWEPLLDPVLEDDWAERLRADVEQATVEARANLEQIRKNRSGGGTDWLLRSAESNLRQLEQITTKDVEALPRVLTAAAPARKLKSSPLVRWLTDRRRDRFAGKGLMLAIRLHALVHTGRSDNNALMWSLRENLGELTDLRQLHEGLDRAGIAGAEQIVAELVLDRWWGAQEVPARVAWPWFAQRPEILERHLRTGEGSESAAKALAVLREFPALPATLLPRLTALALGTGKTHRLAAQQVLEAHEGARTLAEQALSDSKGEVRASATAWLARIGDPAAVPALRAALRTERREEVRAALLTALETLGDDISADLAPDVLQAEAAKGLRGRMPASLAWFPFEQLPEVRWAARARSGDGAPGEVVPADVVRWWVVLATKLRSPSGDGLIARYVGLLDPASRAALGSFVLRAWVAQDTRGPDAEQSRAHADRLAQGTWDRLQSMVKQYPEYYAAEAAKSVEDIWKGLYRDHQATYLGSATQEKGLLALTVGMPGGQLATTAQHYFSAHKGRRAQAEYLVRALAANGDRAAVQQLLAVSRRFKQRTVQDTATALAQDIAERNGWDADQLADRTVQTAGFDDDGILRLDLGAPDGDRVVTGRITEAFTLELRNPAGKVVKALPAKRASDDDEAYTDAKRQLKESRAELKAVVALQTQRFAEAMVTGRTWSLSDWTEFVLGHPLMARLAARLVWAAEVPGADGASATVTFRPGDGGALIGVDDEDVTVPDTAVVSLVHAATLGDDAATGAPAWRAHLADYEITPLFDQGLGAEGSVVLPDLPADARVIDTHEGWLSDSYTIRGRATKLGYTRSQAEDAGWFSAYRREYPSLGITVDIEFTGAFLPEENITAAVRHLVFRRTGTWNDNGRIAVKDVPRVLLAVSYRDYVTVAEGGAFDADWEKKSQY